MSLNSLEFGSQLGPLSAIFPIILKTSGTPTNSWKLQSTYWKGILEFPCTKGVQSKSLKQSMKKISLQ